MGGKSFEIVGALLRNIYIFTYPFEFEYEHLYCGELVYSNGQVNSDGGKYLHGNTVIQNNLRFMWPTFRMIKGRKKEPFIYKFF